MKKILDCCIQSNEQLHNNYVLLKVKPIIGADFPSEIFPGQFVELLVEGSNTTFLRRPISIHDFDAITQEMSLLIQVVGDGTATLASLRVGDKVNMILPLGNGFTLPTTKPKGKLLLIGGGVGVAPLLLLGKSIKRLGYNPIFLLGARTSKDLLQLSEFEKIGDCYYTTEDGSLGEKGFVTNHSILQQKTIAMIYTCGPKPMMIAVANFARREKISCEVSLENTMACGIGACLCCVEDTKKGNVCVCKEGPVFNIDALKW